MRRVAYFQQNTHMGATEEYLLDLIEGIDRARFEPCLIAPTAATLAPLRERARAVGARVLEYDDGAPFGRRARAIRRAIVETSCDVFHSNDPALIGLPLARASGVRSLVVTHHTPELAPRYNAFGRIARAATVWTGATAIFTSEPDRATGIAKEGWRAERTAVIPYGLHFERFGGAARADRRRVRSDLGISEGTFVAACAARLAPQKAHRNLFEALARMGPSPSALQVLLLGDGPLRSELERAARDAGLEGVVRFLGHRADVPAVLAASDAFVMPSLFEGLCYAVAEASAMGLPVAASAVGGIPVTIEDGVTGLLVRPGDIPGLENALRWLVENPDKARAMGAAGRARVQELYSLRAMCQSTAALYDRLERR